MVESEKLCNHNISSVGTELIKNDRDHGGGGGDRSREHRTTKFVSSNSIAHGPGGAMSQRSKSMKGDNYPYVRDESGKPGITRSTSAYYVFSSLPQVVHSIRPRTGYRNNISR